MVTSWPAWVSSYPATSPASPAPTTRTFFGHAAWDNACGVKLQLHGGANCADAARRPSFKNSLRSIGMDIASPYADLMVLIQPELYSGRWGMGSRQALPWDYLLLARDST